MTLDKDILKMATGEHRLDPDQQRRYLGTFAERVILSASITDAEDPQVLAQLPELLSHFQKTYPKLQLKLSAQLTAKAEMACLKAAQDLALVATIVDEAGARSPYGFVLHSDQAVAVDETDLRALYPQFFAAPETPVKTSWWAKLFGGGR